MEHFNKLTEGEAERLALLLEEMGEAQKAIGKILRHGYESYNPYKQWLGNNRQQLEEELGHVLYAVEVLRLACDISAERLSGSMEQKAKSINPYLHHNQSPVLPKWEVVR